MLENFRANVLKLVTEPDSLLLEDRGSETSREGDNQTSTLLLMQ